jgi:hypothetical protein
VVAPVPDAEIEGAVVELLAIVIVAPAAPDVMGVNVTLRVADWLGVRVVPALTPLALNGPVAPLMPEMVIFELPLFFRVTPSDLLLPTFTLPKLNVVGLALRIWVEAVPVPLRLIAVADPGTFVLSDTLPVAPPAVVGAKTASNAMLPFGATVCAAKPVTLKPGPVTLSDETTRSAFPVFLTVIVCESLVPSATLPKATLEGVIDIAGLAPVPVSGMTVGDPDRLVDTEMLPETAPDDFGAKTALKLMLPLEASVCAVKPVTLKPAPVTLSDETAKLAAPVFFSVMTCDPFAPSATVPNVTLDGVTDISPVVPVPLNAIVRVGLEASLAMTRSPVAASPDAGANCTRTVAL